MQDTTDSPSPLLRDSAALVSWAAAACLLTLLNRFIGYGVPLSHLSLAPTKIIAVIYLGVLLYVLLALTRAAARLPLSTVFMLVVGFAFAAPMGLVLALGQARLVPPLWLSLTANNLFLPVGAALVGAGVGRIIKHPNTLIAGAGFSIFFDIVIVTMGTVAQVMQSGSNIISAVSLGAGVPLAPTTGPVSHFTPPPPLSTVTIGPADILFLALFLASVFRLHLSPRATFAWMFALLFAALALVETTGLPVPALAPMGIAVLIANLRHAAFTPTERRDLFIGGGFALVCAVGIIIGSRRLVPVAPPAPPKLGFALKPTGPHSLTIGDVVAGSPAARAGLKVGDTVVSLNDTPAAKLTPQQFLLYRAAAATKGMTFHLRRGTETTDRVITVRP